MKQGIALYERRLGLQVGAAGFHFAPQRRFVLHLPIGHHPIDQPQVRSTSCSSGE